MKRRKLLLLTSGVVLALPSCASKKKKAAEAARKVKVAQAARAKAAAANRQYRPPTPSRPAPTGPAAPRPPRGRGDGVTYRYGSSGQPYVAMTFDDGPHPVLTPRLLDLLRARNIRATFYVIGKNVDRYPHIARRIVSEGHEIGNHTYNHPKLTGLSADAVRRELTKTRDAIVKATGVMPRTMRPPYGALRQDQRRMILSEFNYPTIMWAVDPEDWRKPGVSVVRSRLVNGAKHGAILLAHDIHASTIAAMPGTFDGILAKGLRFVTVSRLIA